MSKPSILFYISGHGYGHAVRESFLINLVPDTFHVVITSTIPESLFHEEITREFSYRNKQFDLGCVQKDAITVDIEATIEQYEKIAHRNSLSLQQECDFYKDMNPVALISDIVPFASEIAKKLQIPSFAISNFSWYETYTHYMNDSSAILVELNRLYTQFDYWIRLTPGETLPDDFRGHETLSDIALLREGNACKDEICEYYGIRREKQIVLLYTGTYGLDRVDWKRLEEFTDCVFIGYYPLPVDVQNFKIVKKERFTLQDFSASADCLISKLGYGIVTEALSSGTPFLFLPRKNFIEYPALKEALEKAGNCELVSEDRFNRLDIRVELYSLLGQKVNPILSSGNRQILQWILARI